MSDPPAAEDGTYWQRPAGWQPPERASVPRRRRGRAVWVVAVALVLLVAGLVAWRLWPSQDDEVQQAAQEFVDAAVTGDCDQAGARATGQVSAQLDAYCSPETGTALAAVAGNSQPRVEVREVDGDQASAVALTSVAGMSLRIDLDMRREAGEWRVAEVGLPGGLPPQLPGG